MRTGARRGFSALRLRREEKAQDFKRFKTAVYFEALQFDTCEMWITPVKASTHVMR
jgi:hypothetical protein